MPDILYQPFPMVGRARAHIWRYAPENRRPRHFHSEPELNLIAAGSATFGIGETVVSVAAGDLLWFPPAHDHVLLEASPDFDLFVIGLTPDLSERVLGTNSAVAYSGPIRLKLAADILAKLRPLCAAPTGSHDVPAVERHIGDFWRQAHALRISAPHMHALTRRTLRSLLARPDLARSDVALLVGGHPSEVSRTFHRDVGLTLTTYRTRLRLLRFIQIADECRDSLLAAALAAGFGSYSQCHRVFQRTFGCSPREFFGSDVRVQMRDTFSPWASAEAPPP